MLRQLDRLLAVMSLPRLSLGIIPAAGQRHCLAQGSFWIFDEQRVHTEGISAGLDITQPREIALHAKAFTPLQKSAVYGHAARELIQPALTEHQHDKDKDDGSGRHRSEDNTGDAQWDRPIPPPPDPNKHDR
jgi:hypothetical protein